MAKSDSPSYLPVDAAISGAHVPQLTLFPRFSESGEAEFGNIGAGLRKHLLKERLLQRRELVVLTLMKGDEAVEAGEEAHRFALCSSGVRSMSDIDFSLAKSTLSTVVPVIP